MRSLKLFDVYRGPGIDENHKSLAFGLIFQDFSSSLTDQAVDDMVKRIIHGVEQELGGKLRD